MVNGCVTVPKHRTRRIVNARGGFLFSEHVRLICIRVSGSTTPLQSSVVERLGMNGCAMSTRRVKYRQKPRPRQGACTCTSRSGQSKWLFKERWQASARAGDTMGAEGKLWQVYKCPSGAGWHITTVRVDPWKKSLSHSEGVES